MTFDYLFKDVEKIELFFLNTLEAHWTYEELSEIRISCFHLESFARVIKLSYEKLSNQREFGRIIQTEAQGIENSISKFLKVHEMVDSFDPEEMPFSILEDSLRELSSKKNSILKSLKEIKVSLFILFEHGDLKDRYLEGFKKELKNINKKIKKINPYFLKDGTYRLRSLLRWVIMHVVYPFKLFAYHNRSFEDSSKYLKLLGGNDAVFLTYEPLEFLSEFVYELGRLKDQGLFLNFKKNLVGEDCDENESCFEAIAVTKKIKNEVLDENLILYLLEGI